MGPVHSDDKPDLHTAGSSNISRRRFLKVAGAVTGGALLAGCQPPVFTPVATSPAPLTPVTDSARARVAIAQATSYDPKLVRQQVETLFDSLGGLQDVVKPGDKVAIKVNLTGGIRSAAPAVVATATESYVTHPAVARAIGELLRDAGAKEIYIVEAVWEWGSFETWGYVTMAKELGATLINLNDPAPYTDYASTPVGKDRFIYEQFTFNHLLEEVDAFVSVPKMKCHYLCGITQSMKNLVGLVPFKFYELKAGDGYRTGLHGPETETKNRLPRVVLDLNRARPINLSLIDAIKTVDGSEGPWNEDLSPKSPGLLIGGKNPVATDAVAVAAMGFDPTADYPNAPFLRADNHLNIAQQLGLGSNRLADIDIVGARLDDMKLSFQPAW
ncbi:hypothetical protein TFLX_04907 [Thermoflexales bacterium]|nr:hypothetical protein TFLX_04907 [Thermoflexales bacterium]